MKRYDILFGRNKLNFTHEGFGNQKQIKAEISLFDSNVATLISEFDGSQYVFYDVQKLLPGSTVKLPSFINNYEINELAVQHLKIKFSQENSKPVTEEYQVLLGAGVGTRKQSIKLLTSLPNRFLTNQPTRKKTTIKSQEWLYFLNNYEDTITEIVAKVKVVFDDDSEAEKYILSQKKVKNALYAIDVSYRHIFRETVIPQGRYIRSYVISLYNKVEPNTYTQISEEREFQVITPSDSDIHIVFRNSLGTFDPIRLVGNQKQTQEIDYANFENEDGVYTSDVTYNRKISMTLGEFEQNWLNYLQELTISKEIYLRSNGSYQRLVCLTKSLPYFDSGKPTDETNIEFRFAENETNFS